MRLNFYFEFPYVDIDAENPILCTSYTHLITSAELYRWYKKNNPEIDIVANNSFYLNYKGDIGSKESYCPSCKFGHFFLIIENPDNKKYFVVSYWDKFRAVNEWHHWDLENCVEKFVAVGIQDNEKDFKPSDIEYTPISYMTLHKSGHDRIEQVYNNSKKIPDRLYFKGGDYDFRSYMHKDPRLDTDNIRVSPIEFIDKISQSAINIDINGAAEVSCRTFDAIGVKSALIRPKLGIRYHNELIPDYHYAALKCEDLGKWNEVADAYIDRFEELKKRPDEIQFLSENGRKWYKENATIDAHVNILKTVINLNKLI